MIAYLADQFRDHWHVLNVVHYTTFRAILAALTSLIIALWFGPLFISWMRHKQVGQPIRRDGPQSHYSKSGTPTMGGAIILVALTASLLLWGDLRNLDLWLLLGTTLGFGAIGWVDDYRKIIAKDSRGLPGRWKYFWQSVLGFSVLGILLLRGDQSTILYIPCFKELAFDLGIFYILFAYFVIVGSSNAVNLTDGLDGLAMMPTTLVAAGLGVFGYASGHADFASYLNLPYIPGVGEVTVFAAALCGAGLGFLWYNSYPAQVFMGDVGALALGASLGLMAVLIHQEIILFFMGGIFVLETISVILQVGSFKLTGRRVFKMAPIHHHFELLGWPESKIVVRFWIITVILVLLALSTLKLR